jgi:uracil-DNA glycosylase family 4
MSELSDAAGKAASLLAEIRDGVGNKPRASNKLLGDLRHLAAGQNRPPLPGISGERPAALSSPTEHWTWESLQPAVLACTRCSSLVASRTQVVFGVGNRNADLMFVGEAPGADEDLAGEPFVGKAGQLLTKIIETMGLSRDDVFIANVLKCRPDMPKGSSGNRKPRPDEMSTCLPWLTAQIALVKPRVLVALGATAAEGLLGETAPMKELRGRWFAYSSIPVAVTYHPAYLLRNQSLSEKRKVWEDMLMVMEKLEMPVSEKQRSFFLKTS